MRTRFRFSIVAVAVAVAVFVAGVSVATAFVRRPAFVHAGTTRYAMSSAGPAAPVTTNSTSFVEIPGLANTIKIGTGKTAELIINFSGEVNSCDVMYVQAVVDGVPASPSSTQLIYRAGQNTGADSTAFTFFYKGLGAGTHRVAMQWHGLSACNQQFMDSRSMVVTANIH
jgi:hypothetical protein